MSRPAARPGVNPGQQIDTEPNFGLVDGLLVLHPEVRALIEEDIGEPIKGSTPEEVAQWLRGCMKQITWDDQAARTGSLPDQLTLMRHGMLKYFAEEIEALVNPAAH